MLTMNIIVVVEDNDIITRVVPIIPVVTVFTMDIVCANRTDYPWSQSSSQHLSSRWFQPSWSSQSFFWIKDIKIKLHIDASVPQVLQRHRHILFHVCKDVEKELDRLKKMDVIEKVEGPTPWTSPLVVVCKKAGGVRICVDMREPNKAIWRERHPVPTFDNLFADLNGSTVFSKLDLTNRPVNLKQKMA
ncbi:uncharacterized protein LOC121368936 [Gigantopelta aegis]|uniref:uncharacterized protein LOC121368936 n=1 Tax=Gigantopelta aegis TaxID=1735272 RepID=UPI001B889CE6|nr:uncharacterized protein LOC121368936 [Gigantopelta aegis]